MTPRSFLLHLTALVLVALTCSVGSVLAAPQLAVRTSARSGPTAASGPAAAPSGAAASAPVVTPSGGADSDRPGARHPDRPGPPADRTSGLAPPALPLPGPGRYAWPLASPHPVVRPFQPPSTLYGPGHRGVDLGSQPNAEVLAAGDGVVVFAGPLAGRGVVSVAHAGDIRTTYEPLTVLVSTGQRITRGTVIGLLTLGHNGCAAAACLHWGARRGPKYVDPLGLLSTGRVRLLPWEER
ncbi:murein hydrolase activator EnvC family protein [Actinophytocola sp.]|uniref:murein hydrolase activator EnvC family protein n=1 Tax=Actinophytocola sp. TaxID=1872138 RepID=UPI00389ACF9F